MNHELEQLIDEIMQFLWSDNPVSATMLGIHSYDGELDRLGPEHQNQSISRKKDYWQKLNKYIQENQFSIEPTKQIDALLLRNALSVDIEKQEKIKPLLRDASIYPKKILFGIYILLLRDFASIEQRAGSILSRLWQIPRVLNEGIENLGNGENIPKIWVEIAMEITRDGQLYIQDIIPKLGERVPDIRENLLSASSAALQSLEDYHKFLQEKLLPKATGSFAIGKNLFQFLLDTEHQLPYSVDELIELGEKVMRESSEKIYRCARGINSTVNWREILHEMKNEYPAKDNMLQYYQDTMEEIKEFLIEKKLVTIPENQTLKIIETPIFGRATVPYAAYTPPAPFEENQTGFFWVTPVDASKSNEEQTEQYQGHSIYNIPITVIHEAYPGHHLQLCHSNRNISKVRRQFGTNVFIEGWALYCEELMWENGYYTDAKIRLMQLKDTLWRACRVVIDAKLHSGNMTFNEAVDLLVNTADLERSNAIREVKRYTQSPTQPMSYLAGKIALMDLRKEYKNKIGHQFNSREFHDKLLGFGSIPIKIIREEMLKE